MIRLEEDEEYRPLPDGLFIGTSPIEGQGLFTDRLIPAGGILGVSHLIFKVEDGSEMDPIRTPLGGFINHSDNPNCDKEPLETGHFDVYLLATIKEIQPGEELTLSYTLTQTPTARSQP